MLVLDEKGALVLSEAVREGFWARVVVLSAGPRLELDQQ